ncbi:MAG: MFS transporter [Pseudomonadota bacterium]|nr:MFS transporter [Pseudomonadota bacterium]
MVWFDLNLSDSVRPSFRAEKLTECTLPITLVLLEGGVVGVIAAKVYQVSPFVLAVITAAPMFANLSSFAWNRIAAGRAKVQLACLLQAAVLLCVLAVALAPINDVGALILVASMVISRVLVAGLITIRSVIWSLNYARSNRAQATGQLQMIASLVTVVIASAVGPFLDQYPDGLSLLYAVGTAVGLLGIVFFRRVSVIGENDHLLQEREALNQRRQSVGFLTILRNDQKFTRYQISMFAAGFGNMLIEAPLIFLITRELSASYATSIGLTMVIPFAISLLSLPLWARYLDRVHVAQFRARQSVLWVLAQVLTLVGALLGSIAWLAISRVVMGVARGGGSLAWQLGHNDFARADQLSAYMGIHVTLTGVRGAIAPMLGMFLYTQLGGASDNGAGAWVFAVAAFVSGLSGIGFNRLYRQMKADGSIALKPKQD